MYFVFWLGRLMTRSSTLSWINLQHENITWWRPAVSGRNITMNSGVSLVRHKITELMHNYPPTIAITTIAIRLGRQDEMNGVLWFVCFKGQDKKRTRILVSKKRNFLDIDKWTISTYWMQTETRLLFVRPTHAIKRERARIRFSIEKKQSNYYDDTAIVSTKTREQVGTDEN